jgi:hypothetical protein
MISSHLAQTLLHYGLNNLQIRPMHNLFVKERVKDRSQQLFIMYLLDRMSLDSSNPPYFLARCIHLSTQLISLLVIVIHNLLYFLKTRSLLYIYIQSMIPLHLIDLTSITSSNGT